jgi:hypothetical protein
MTVGSHIILKFSGFPDLNLLIKFATSEKKLRILCDRKGIDSVFVLKQSGQ